MAHTAVRSNNVAIMPAQKSHKTRQNKEQLNLISSSIVSRLESRKEMQTVGGRERVRQGESESRLPTAGTTSATPRYTPRYKFAIRNWPAYHLRDYPDCQLFTSRSLSLSLYLSLVILLSYIKLPNCRQFHQFVQNSQSLKILEDRKASLHYSQFIPIHRTIYGIILEEVIAQIGRPYYTHLQMIKCASLYWAIIILIIL